MYFVDYGNHDYVSHTSIYPALPDVMQLPECCIHATLAFDHTFNDQESKMFDQHFPIETSLPFKSVHMHIIPHGNPV